MYRSGSIATFSVPYFRMHSIRFWGARSSQPLAVSPVADASQTSISLASIRQPQNESSEVNLLAICGYTGRDSPIARSQFQMVGCEAHHSLLVYGFRPQRECDHRALAGGLRQIKVEDLIGLDVQGRTQDLDDVRRIWPHLPRQRTFIRSARWAAKAGGQGG